MKKQSKKLIAPIAITLLCVVYLILFCLFGLTNGFLPLAVRIPAGVIPLALAGVSLYVLIERIKEIRSGEEDDLSQY